MRLESTRRDSDPGTGWVGPSPNPREPPAVQTPLETWLGYAPGKTGRRPCAWDVKQYLQAGGSKEEGLIE